MSDQRYVIDLLDSSNNPIGSGPLHNVLSVSVNERLDEAGTVSFSVPATDTKAAELIATADRFRVRFASGVLRYGIIDKDVIDAATDQPVRTVTGYDMLRELAHYSMGWWCFYADKDINTVVLPELVADTPWATGTIDAALGDLYYRFDGDSRLSALYKIAQTTGKHFRLGSTFRTFDFGAFGAASSIRFANVAHAQRDTDTTTDLAIIGSLQITSDRGPVVNRIIPWGAGEDGGDTNRAKVSLFHLTPGDSRWANIKAKAGVRGTETTISAVGESFGIPNARYTVADSSGFYEEPVNQVMWCYDKDDLTLGLGYDMVISDIEDATHIVVRGSPSIPSPPTSFPATFISNPQLYIQDDTAWADDPHEAVLIFTDVTLTDLGLDAFELAASQLYERAYNYLQAHKVPQVSYAVSVLNCPESLRVGDTVQIIYRGVVTRSGAAVKWVDINESLNVINITRTFNADGSTSATVEVSNIARQATDSATSMFDNGAQVTAQAVTVGKPSVSSSGGGGGGSGGAGDPLTFTSPLVRTVNNITINDAVADGATKGAAAFNATDFNSAAGVISIDYTNGFDPKYLRLDATNDPVTGALDIKVDSTNALRVLTAASAEIARIDTSAKSFVIGDGDGHSVSETVYDGVSGGRYLNYRTNETDTFTILQYQPNGTPPFNGTSFEFLADDSLINNRRFLMASLTSVGAEGFYLASDKTGLQTNMPLIFRVGNADWSTLPNLLTLTATSGTITQDFTVDGQTSARNETKLIINANTAKQAQLNLRIAGADKWALYVPSGSTDIRIYNYALTNDALTIVSATNAATFIGTVTSKPGASAGIALDPNAATGDYTLSLSPANLTAARRVTFPDATGTAALLQVANVFTAQQQITVPTATAIGLILKTSDNNTTNNLAEWRSSADAVLGRIIPTGALRLGSVATAIDANYLFQIYENKNAAAGFAVRNLGDGTAAKSELKVMTGDSAFSFNVFSASYTPSGIFTGNRSVIDYNGAQGLYLGASSATGTLSLYAGGLGSTQAIFHMTAGLRVRIGLYSVTSPSALLHVYGRADEPQLIVTGHTTQAVGTAIAQVTRNDTAAGVSTLLGLTGLGSGANGDGVAQTFAAKSSTTAAQTQATVSTLWTDATHASKTSRLDVTTTGPGKCGSWGYSGIANTALTIIANGTGDVTEGITVQYVASEVTGTDAGGGTVFLEPGDSTIILSDSTNTLTLTCAADGSVTIVRSAGTDTYKFQCWAVWV